MISLGLHCSVLAAGGSWRDRKDMLILEVLCEPVIGNRSPSSLAVVWDPSRECSAHRGVVKLRMIMT